MLEEDGNPLPPEFKPLGGPIISPHDGDRVDNYMAKTFPFYSRAQWQKRIDEGHLLVNHKSVRPSYHLRALDRIHFFHPEEHEPIVDSRIKIIYEEKGVLCAYKPPTLPMHEGGAYRKRTFHKFLGELAGREWAAIHRLDRETSGVVLCGGTGEIRRQLTAQFLQHQIVKEYIAISRGEARAEKWDVDAALGKERQSRIRIKRWVAEDGDPAFTSFECVGRKKGYSLIKAFPRTGRTNQIRIHAAFSGLPLVGDKLYYPDENIFLEYHELGMTDFVCQTVGHPRTCLHAQAISFFHPILQEKIRIESQMPVDMSTLWHGFHG